MMTGPGAMKVGVAKRFGTNAAPEPARPIQRFHLAAKATSADDAAGYEQVAKPNARGFSFQSVRVSRTENAATGVATYKAANVVHRVIAPQLKVSAANDMAVPISGGAEARTFFATDARREASNVLLHNAGTPLRLRSTSGSITVPAHLAVGPTKLADVSLEFAKEPQNHECGSFAHDVLGPRFDAAVTTVTPAGHDIGAPQRSTKIDAALGGQQPATVGANEAAAPEVGEAFGIFAQPNAALQHAADLLEMNRYDAAEQNRQQGEIAAAEALEELMHRIKGAVSFLTWNEHWAGVVAKSGGDSVTLENYNRTAGDAAAIEAAVEKDYPELVGWSRGAHAGSLPANQRYQQKTAEYAVRADEGRLARLKRLGMKYMRYAVAVDANTESEVQAKDRWYFAMYGQNDQSFHAKWSPHVADDVSPVTKQARTFRMIGTDVELQARLVAKLDGLVPNDIYKTRALTVRAAQRTLVLQAVGRAPIIAAYVAAERAIAVARLDGALAVMKQKAGKDAGKKQRLTAAHALAVQAVHAAEGDAIGPAAQQRINRMSGLN